MKFENVSVMNFEGAIRGMRNPHDSWKKSDSFINENNKFVLGENDKKLGISLIKAGSEHRKFLRQIFVSVDISAPLYWWKEFDTYKVGTVSNSCSTMHTLTKQDLSLEMFECNDIDEYPKTILKKVIAELNKMINSYIEIKDKKMWKGIITLLPESFIQKRTITMSYENLFAMCSKGQRRFHKLTEWSTDFINWARSLPYAQEFIFTDELGSEE